MVCYPEAQKEAQAELDKVLNGRLPEHSDFPSLPYLSALVKEVYRYAEIFFFQCSLLPIDCVFRWNSIVPLSKSCSFLMQSNKLISLFRQVPHQSTSDDIYRGYHIPANTTVTANQW